MMKVITGILSLVMMVLPLHGVSDRYKHLSEDSAADAERYFWNAGWKENFRVYPQKLSKNYQERQYWLSRNKELRTKLANYFEDAPHTLKNAGERRKNLSLLGRLRSEWSVRLLFEEVMKDRDGQQINGLEEYMKRLDPKLRENPEVRQAVLILLAEQSKVVRSDRYAVGVLGRLGLKEVSSFDPMKNKISDVMEEMREWYPANKDRLDEVVLATWPDALVDEKVEVEEEGAVSGGLGVVGGDGESVEWDEKVDDGNDGVLRGDVVEETRAWGWYVGALVFLVMLGGWFFVGRRG